MQKTLTIATRKSPLALWQAYHVRDALEQMYPGLNVQLLEMSTEGDERLDVSLTKIGGKGVFVKALEHALFDGRADLAVHSLKDVPMVLPDGLELACYLARETPSDAMVCRSDLVPWSSMASVPQGARIGTSSLRRVAQLMAIRPDLHITPVRGNLGTRLAKLDANAFDALMLATAGLKRLDLTHRIAFETRPEDVLPACGQGILGIEIRSEDAAVRQILAPLADQEATPVARCERALNRFLNGGCQVPIAAYAIREGSQLWLRALVGSADCSQVIRAEARGLVTAPEDLGVLVGQDLERQGARELLAGVGHS